MDEDKDVKEVVEPVEPSTTEPTPEEVKEPEAEVATEAEEPKTETEGKGANQRIRELNAKAKEAEAKAEKAEEKAKSLSERLAEITEPIGSQEQQVPEYKPQVEAGQEITPEQYQGDVGKTANAIVEIRLKQERAINRINNEARDSIHKYSQLDPESENFDRELSDTVTEATEHYIKSSPYSAEVSKFVDRQMKPYLGSVTKEVGKQTENIAKQVSDAALRPTSVRKSEKTAAEKTVEELEQELGITQA